MENNTLQTLVYNYEKYAKYLCSKYLNSKASRRDLIKEDLYQEALLGLIESVLENKSIDLFTLKTKITNKIEHYIAKNCHAVAIPYNLYFGYGRYSDKAGEFSTETLSNVEYCIKNIQYDNSEHMYLLYKLNSFLQNYVLEYGRDCFNAGILKTLCIDKICKKYHTTPQQIRDRGAFILEKFNEFLCHKHRGKIYK